MIDVTELQPAGVDRFETRARTPPPNLDTLSRDIVALKKKLNAVILAHNYQVPEIQDIADYVGDSLGLAQQAAKTKAEVIVFCGVHFMAETAKILNPDKIVVLPDKDAGCSLEASCPGDKLKALQDTNPNFWTIAYINCSAEVKALSDVICTSGNAVKIVNAAPAEKDLLFVPDENLGAWVMEQTGRPMTLWRGNCYVHVEFTHASITRIRREFPNAPLVAHPECTKAVRMLADEVCSTEKMVAYCKKTPAKEREKKAKAKKEKAKAKKAKAKHPRMPASRSPIPSTSPTPKKKPTTCKTPTATASPTKTNSASCGRAARIWPDSTN